MPAWKRYVNAFRKDLDAWAVWEPGEPVDIGDYGSIDRGRWRKLGTLWSLVERPEHLLVQESTPTDVQYGSAAVSAIEARAGTTPDSGAYVRMKFVSQDALFLRAHCSTHRSVANRHALDGLLLTLRERWQKDWLLVTGVRAAARFTVLAAGKGGGEIAVSAPLPELQSFLLGSATLSPSLQISGSVYFSYIGCSGPILMDLVRIKRGLLGEPRVGTEDFDLDDGLNLEVSESVAPSDIYGEGEPGKLDTMGDGSA